VGDLRFHAYTPQLNEPEN